MVTMLHAEALMRDLVRYRDSDDYVVRDRIGQRMVDTVIEHRGDEGYSVHMVELIMALPDSDDRDYLVNEILKIISPGAAS